MGIFILISIIMIVLVAYASDESKYNSDYLNEKIKHEIKSNKKLKHK